MSVQCRRLKRRLNFKQIDVHILHIVYPTQLTCDVIATLVLLLLEQCIYARHARTRHLTYFIEWLGFMRNVNEPKKNCACVALYRY